MNYDLIISDEKSTDGTIEIAQRNSVPVYQRDGSGKGYGIQKALEVALKQGYDVLVLIDCDNSYPAERITDLLKFFPQYDLVVGARNMKDIQISHRLVNIFHTGLVNSLFGSKLKDINSGMRALKVEKFEKLLTAEGFDIEAQITTVALKNKFKIEEIAIPYYKRTGNSKIKAWDTFVIIKRILKERFS